MILKFCKIDVQSGLKFGIDVIFFNNESGNEYECGCVCEFVCECECEFECEFECVGTEQCSVPTSFLCIRKPPAKPVVPKRLCL